MVESGWWMPTVRISVIAPTKALFDYNKWTGAVKDTLHRKTEPGLKNLFKGTTEGWKSQPDFIAHHFQTNSSIGVEVYTRDAIYGLVNAGSPVHLIRPRSRGGFLRFQVGYRSATRPGRLQSSAYRRFGMWIGTNQVRHPGFAARKFDEQIAEAYGPTFVEDMQKTFAEGLP